MTFVVPSQAEVLVPEAGKVIHLKGGAIWLGMRDVASSDLYVRRCYAELFQAKDAYIKAKNWEGKGPMIVYTGTPGVCLRPLKPP